MLIFKQTIDLDSSVYHDALKLRQEVFVKEQNVAEADEIDGESGPLYFVGYSNNEPLVTARVFEETPKTWHIQRVAVKKSVRKRGLGSRIIIEIEDNARKKGIGLLTLGAQDQAQTFYLKLGFKVQGAAFLEAGIKHHRMDKMID